MSADASSLIIPWLAVSTKHGQRKISVLEMEYEAGVSPAPRLRRRRLTPRATAALSVPINDFYNRSSLLQNTDATFIPDTTSVLVNPCLTSTTTSTPSSAWGISTTPLSPPVSRAALLSSRNCHYVRNTDL